jgi:hypothetical protein
MKSLKPITMYECQHCKKLFKTPDKHNCRRDPDKTNCYSCEHWGNQFCFDKSWDHSGDATCTAKEACKIYGQCAEEAFEIMRGKGWHLDCSDYKLKVLGGRPNA